MITQNREYRSFDFETNEMRVTGKPVIFNQRTLMYEIGGVKYFEQIDARAFDGADMSDVVLNVDHGGKPAAKTKNGTLTLEVRGDALYMDADLSRNATGRELKEDIDNGFYDKMSFAFIAQESEYDKESRTRTITKIEKLYDVSAVTWPAYSQTSIQARSFFEAEAERERAEARNALELAKAKYFYGGLTDGTNRNEP